VWVDVSGEGGRELLAVKIEQQVEIRVSRGGWETVRGKSRKEGTQVVGESIERKDRWGMGRG